MIGARDIEEVAARIGQAANAERVVLFGSHARGSAGETSDVDLLIIAESELPRFKRARDLYKMFRPYPYWDGPGCLYARGNRESREVSRLFRLPRITRGKDPV